MMMTNHPIAPPPELVQQWWEEVARRVSIEADEHIAEQAAQWGADQELKACVDVILTHPGLEHPDLLVEVLCAARRPKPPSLKKQALEAVDRCDNEIWCEETESDFAIIRTALEQLSDD